MRKLARLLAVIVTTVTVSMTQSVFAGEVTVNAEARAFKPDIVYVQPGDTVGWVNMTSHNSVSVEGVIPEGATPWASQLGENLKVTLDKEGVYGYVCQPHIGFGMIGVIVVGKPANLEAATKYVQEKYTGTPYARLLGKLKQVKAQ
ncbi:MAG: plastocyanin/azurin family copper-binding protein [Gammaproteobacteria bacterium]